MCNRSAVGGKLKGVEGCRSRNRNSTALSLPQACGRGTNGRGRDRKVSVLFIVWHHLPNTHQKPPHCAQGSPCRVIQSAARAFDLLLPRDVPANVYSAPRATHGHAYSVGVRTQGTNYAGRTLERAAVQEQQGNDNRDRRYQHPRRGRFAPRLRFPSRRTSKRLDHAHNERSQQHEQPKQFIDLSQVCQGEAIQRNNCSVLHDSEQLELDVDLWAERRRRRDAVQGPCGANSCQLPTRKGECSRLTGKPGDNERLKNRVRSGLQVALENRLCDSSRLTDNRVLDVCRVHARVDLCQRRRRLREPLIATAALAVLCEVSHVP